MGTVGAWCMLQATAAGETRLQLDHYAGLAVGDIVEIDIGTNVAEVVTIVRFGTVIASAPTRYARAAGAPIRRLLEGNGERWIPAASEVNATPSSRPRSSLQDAEGFVDRDSWSPREREHQLTRWKRKRRDARLQEQNQVQQPALHVQVRQPDKMTLAPWPELPFVKSWLQ